MLRVFLKKKIDGNGSQFASHPEPKATVPWADRRRYERFNIDYKHITIQNESDILTIRELSIQGFSAEVSPRFFERVEKNDIFEARLRYMGEIYDLNIRVAWKAGTQVGFQLLDAPSSTQIFLRRVLHAANIGNSLAKKGPSSKPDDESATFKDWFHSPLDADLFVWRHQQSGSVTAWQLTLAPMFIEWSDSLGLVTGSLVSNLSHTITQIAQGVGNWLKPDNQIDLNKKQFAIDVLLALRDPVRDELVATLTTPDGGV